MSLTLEEIRALRNSHSPQPTKGAVGSGPGSPLWIASLPSEFGGGFGIWDSRQTVGYLCRTHSPSTLIKILDLERESPGFLRELVTGEPSPWRYVPQPIEPTEPPAPEKSPAKNFLIDINKLKEKEKSRK